MSGSEAEPSTCGMPASIVAEAERDAERRSTFSNGCEVVWRIWGHGRPVLLLHGNFGGWTHWIRNIPALAARHRVVVPDLPGFGDSSTFPEPHTVDAMSALLTDGLRQLGTGQGPLTIVGFSFGSTIAGCLARDLAEEVDRLVVVSAGQVGARRQAIPPFKSWRKASSEEERNAAHRENLEIMMISAPDRVTDLAVHLQGWNASRRRIRTEEMTAHHPLREILFSLNCPITGIWGGKDATIGPFIQDRLDLIADLGAKADAVVVEDAGHWLQYEAAQAFNETLLQLLSRPSRSDVGASHA